MKVKVAAKEIFDSSSANGAQYVSRISAHDAHTTTTKVRFPEKQFSVAHLSNNFSNPL